MEKSSVSFRFPCDECPAEPGLARLLGIYDQRQAGLRMQRVKTPGGRITPGRLRALADLARRHTPGHALHVTTRQCLEFHGLRPEDVPAVQRGIGAAGLTAMGAGGDTLRNITVCPSDGCDTSATEVSPVAEAIMAAAESLPFLRSLPRKFKIGICGCGRACTRPWIDDLGLVALPGGAFRAIGAGSLGPHPATGIELYSSIQPQDVVPLAVAALRLFNAEGDRGRRGRARLRHVREQMGDVAFRGRLDKEFSRSRREGVWPAVETRQVSDARAFAVRLHLPYGALELDIATELARAAEECDGEIRLGLVHDVYLFAKVPLALSMSLEGLRQGPAAVACPGSTWCSRGLADSRAAERRIRAALGGQGDLFIGIAGCPNHCALAPIADIGLTGFVRMVEGKRKEFFRIFAGGGCGRTPELGRVWREAIPAEDVGAAAAELATDGAVMVRREERRGEKGCRLGGSPGPGQVSGPFGPLAGPNRNFAPPET